MLLTDICFAKLYLYLGQGPSAESGTFNFYLAWPPNGVIFLSSYFTERDSLTVSMLACHAADPGSNPAQGDDFFNYFFNYKPDNLIFKVT